MIRFQCAACQKVLKADNEGAGRKVSCPRCGQRLLIPPPPPIQVQNKTVLGQAKPDSVASATRPATDRLSDIETAEEKRQLLLTALRVGSQSNDPNRASGRWFSQKVKVKLRMALLTVGLLAILSTVFVCSGGLGITKKFVNDHVLPAALASEPETCRDLVERLQVKGLDVVLVERQPTVTAKTGVYVLPKQATERGIGSFTMNEPALRNSFVDTFVTILHYESAREARDKAGATKNGIAYGRFVLTGKGKLFWQVKKELGLPAGEPPVETKQKDLTEGSYKDPFDDGKK